MQIKISLLLAVVLSSVTVSSVNAAESAAKPVKPSAEVKKKAEINAAVVAYGKVGVRRCLRRIGQVTDFLTAGSKSGIFLFSPPEEPDNRMLSTSMEIESNKVLSYASTSYHPRDNDCAGVYEAITYWQDSCQTVATKAYSNLRQTGVIQTQVIVLDGGPAMRVFLMPAGVGCVAIKKEVIY